MTAIQNDTVHQSLLLEWYFCCFWTTLNPVVFFLHNSNPDHRWIGTFTSQLIKLIEAEWRKYASPTYAIIGPDNGLSPGRWQPIIWTSDWILLIEPLGRNFNEILIKIYTFSFKKIHLTMSSGKGRPFCLGLNVLNMCITATVVTHRGIMITGFLGILFGNDNCILVSLSMLSCFLPASVFLAATKQLYEWFSPSVCLSVCPSVTPFLLCSHHRITMKFSGVITSDRSDVHAKGQGQRSKVKVTEVTTQLNRFRTVTPVWIHIWWWNDAYSLIMPRGGALLFFKVIRQISRSHGSKNRWIWPRLGVSGL